MEGSFGYETEVRVRSVVLLGYAGTEPRRFVLGKGLRRGFLVRLGEEVEGEVGV